MLQPLHKTVLIPTEESCYAFADFHPVCPAELVKLRDINQLSGCTIGLAGIELDNALEANLTNNQL